MESYLKVSRLAKVLIATYVHRNHVLKVSYFADHEDFSKPFVRRSRQRPLQ